MIAVFPSVGAPPTGNEIGASGVRLDSSIGVTAAGQTT